MTFRRAGDSPAVPVHCEGSLYHEAEGGEALVQLHLSRKKDSLVSRFVEVNQRLVNLQEEVKRRLFAEKSARDQEQLTRITLASIGDGVITTDVDSNISYMNGIAETLTGWALEEAQGRPLDEVFHVIDEITGEPLGNPAREVLSRREVMRLGSRNVLIGKGGGRAPIDDSVAPISDSDGQLLGTVLVFHEISERRRMEQELEAQADELRKADARKNEFLALLAHELRNPLAALHSGIEIQRLQGSAADIPALSSMMERQSLQLKRLIDDLLDVARITRGTIEVSKAPVPLARILEHAIETVRPLIRERRHELKVSLPGDEVVVDADFVRLAQVFSNLLNNAAKFMEPGGTITLRSDTDSEDVIVSVADRGRGMGADFLAQAFEFFTQEDTSIAKRHGGLGIGLSLVKTLVDLHGGEITAFSEGPGKGSRFLLRLPLSKAARTEEAASAGEEHGPVGARVLIVDDNVDAAESLAILLRSWGCDVNVATDAGSALASRKSDPVDVILLDIGLPDIDGFEVARRVRELPDAERTRLIAVTGYGWEIDPEQFSRSGFDAHLTKPVDLAQLKRVIATG